MHLAAKGIQVGSVHCSEYGHLFLFDTKLSIPRDVFRGWESVNDLKHKLFLIAQIAKIR